MTKFTRDFYWIILVAVLANSLLWLDSLDSYLNSRLHIYLSHYLPDAAFTPSRVLRQAMAPNSYLIQPASITPIIRPLKPAPPALTASAMSLPSAVSAVTQALPIGSGEPQATAQKTAMEPPEPPAVPDVKPEQPTLAVADPNLKVLFAGDSMMQGVAPMVISRLRKDYPKGVFIDASKPSTGLASRRYYDWPAKIREESIKHGIQVIVMFLGPNDPWDIFEEKKRYAFPSKSWEEKYRNRVDNILDFAAASGIRVIWIGLPVMRDERIQLGAIIENRIFQDEAKKYKFDYLPTENFLGSLNEPYTKYIEDPKKGKLAVRLDDGVHFTQLGLRLISSRVGERLKNPEKI
jgi:hypothetical protein